VSGWTLGGVVALGVFHGVNPAMGWLFAVAIGLQEGSRRAVLRALPPIAVGHAAAVALALLVVTEAQAFVSEWTLRLAGFGALAVFAWWRFVRPHAHVRWSRIRLRPRELAAWSFLVSSAHGAGLMLFPVLLGLHAHTHDDAAALDLGSGSLAQDAAAVLVHMAAMLVVMGGVALIVYEKVGVGFLRWGWINLDVLWAAAFVTVGIAALFT
jgi:hypothetical protein